MKIVLLASYYYPLNDVSSLRIHSYCKALVQKGNDVTVLMVYPAMIEDSGNGNYEGVNYVLLGNPKHYNGNFISKIYYRIYGLFTIGKYIFTKDLSAVLSYHDNLVTNICVKIFTKLTRLPFLMDKTEYPYGYFEMTDMQKKLQRLNLSLFDGFIVISNELKSFYSKFSKNIFLLPMTIDPCRFEHVIVGNQDVEQYICLTFGVHNRDGLFDSIVAFHKYLTKSEKKLFKLYLIGDFSKLCEVFPQSIQMTQYIEEHQLQNSVIFLGKLPIEEVPKILAEAKCLITTPTKYTSGGFPTKIGEYMLSGTPLVTTIAGEISDYLTNKYDSLLCAVGDLDCIAENIIYIEENPAESSVIGTNAISTAKFKFNASTYIDDLVVFINSIKR